MLKQAMHSSFLQRRSSDSTQQEDHSAAKLSTLMYHLDFFLQQKHFYHKNEIQNMTSFAAYCCNSFLTLLRTMRQQFRPI